jgi:cytochrome c553
MPRWGLMGSVVLAACQSVAAGPPAPPPPPPSVRFEHDMLVRFHMHENFGLLRAIEKLLLRGNLDDARALASGIAAGPDEPGLSQFAAQATLVRTRAEILARATRLDDACRAEARVADACAGCHAAAGAVPQFRPPAPVPHDAPSMEARMKRHLWATDRLWEGIVGGDQESWRTGLDILAASPTPEMQPTPERAKLARRMQQLADAARRGNRTDAPVERATSYGEILVTCASCHASAK